MTVATPFQELWTKAGFTEQTPIQLAVEEPLRTDKHIVGLAPTGSGKTLAFGLPLLSKIVPGDGLQVLMLAPSQELAIQTRDVLTPYAQAVGAHVVGIMGNANVARQKEQLKKRPEVIVATAGRLIELISAGRIKLHTLQTIVVDEADELLREPGLGQVREIVNHAPAEVQMTFFSATSSPILRELPKWFAITDVETLDVRPIDHTQGPVDHFFLQGGREHQVEWLGRLAQTPNFQALVFFNKNSSMSRVAGILRHQKVTFAVLGHEDRSINRKQTMALFRKHKISLLLVTDLAGRGLDIAKLPAVINFEVPRNATTYIHRAGRTGRMGEPGTVITMGNDHDLRDLRKLVGDYDIKRAWVTVKGLTTDRPEHDEEAQPSLKKKPFVKRDADGKPLNERRARPAGARPTTGKPGSGKAGAAKSGAKAPFDRNNRRGAEDEEKARKPHIKVRHRDQKNKGKRKTDKK